MKGMGPTLSLLFQGQKEMLVRCHPFPGLLVLRPLQEGTSQQAGREISLISPRRGVSIQELCAETTANRPTLGWVFKPAQCTKGD